MVVGSCNFLRRSLVSKAWYTKPGWSLKMESLSAIFSNKSQPVMIYPSFEVSCSTFWYVFIKFKARADLLNTLRGDLGHLSANFGLRVEVEVRAHLPNWCTVWKSNCPLVVVRATLVDFLLGFCDALEPRLPQTPSASRVARDQIMLQQCKRSCRRPFGCEEMHLVT